MSDIGQADTNDDEDEAAGTKSTVRLVRRWGPFVAVAVLLAAAVVVFRGGGDSDDGGEATGDVAADREELILSGPMTPEKAELLDEDFEYGPKCDPDTELIMLPSVYAPPCVEPFDGDNGGATNRGVTGETVKLVAYVGSLGSQGDAAVGGTGADLDAKRQIQTVEDYVNLYHEVFETYGRRVEVEVFNGTGAMDDAAAAKADAIAIAEREPFAVVGGPDQASQVFADELAAREVLCLEGCAVGLPDSFLAEHAPYVWMGGSPEQWVRQSAEAIAKLAGPGKAEMAGDPELAERERVYAAVHYDTPDGVQAETFEEFRDELADQGIELHTDVEYFLDMSRMQESVRTWISQFKSAGVTTVIYGGDPITPTALTAEATAQDYFPEWILGSNYLADSAQFGRDYDPDQWANGFGVITRYPAAEGLDTPDQLYEWGYGTEPPSNIAGVLEPPLRMLFTGIHLAGPDLTPETFRDGMVRYPPSGGGPTRPTLAWGTWDDLDDWPGGDVTLVWWDPEAEGIDEGGEPGQGMYRFANGGQRYAPGEIPDTPDEAGLFDEESSVIEYDQLPPEDQAPDYSPPSL